MATKFLTLKNYRTKVSSYGGVYTVTIFTPPHDCGGKCIFCPKTSRFPNSYIINASVQFAESVDYDPAKQFRRFSNAFKLKKIQGPIPIEIIILGGSFCSFPKKFRSEFVNLLHDEMCGVKNSTSYERENCFYRCSILTVEARPDQITQDECAFLQSIGVTKVEIGAQHFKDSVLTFNERGHNSKTIRKATLLLKQNGFKVGYHIMLGLPGSSFIDDTMLLKKKLWDVKYSPDFLKIYPCVLLKDKSYQPRLHELYNEINWRPPSISSIKKLLMILANNVPTFVRISRVQRFFPHHFIHGEYQKGLRENNYSSCFCVRCREVGKLRPNQPSSNIEKYKIIKTIHGNDKHYEIVTKDNILLALARIHFIEGKCAFLREIHTYGAAAPIGTPGNTQGKGIGKHLLKEIELDLTETKYKTLFINAGIGARSFFLKVGYRKSDSNLLYKNFNCFLLLGRTKLLGSDQAK